MTSPQMRVTIITLVDEATASGARRSAACALIGLDVSTLRRWRPTGTNAVVNDQRPLAKRPTPAHKLTRAERQTIVDVCKRPEFSSLPPTQIVPKLADKGEYIASESSFYRVLRDEGLLQHRGRTKKAVKRTAPPYHKAIKPNDVWTYDITFLPSRVRGQFFYLYMVQDLCSRYGVNWEVHDTEHADHNARLIQQAILKAGCYAKPPALHSDNGSGMKALTMRKKLIELGITPTFSRPSVSNDNAFIESMFRTVKYCPQWPSGGFATLDDARTWVQKFMLWYNEKHQHSGIKFVTPAERYAGRDIEILARRKELYQAARQSNPGRWSGNIRDWTPIEMVELNPVKNAMAVMTKMGRKAA